MQTLATPKSRAAAPLAGRLALTALAALAEAGHLAWESAHGGIVSHHLLANAELPALWNGWGMLVLPAIAWVASSRLIRAAGRGGRLDRAALFRLAAALAAGVALSFAFATGRGDLAGGLFLGIALSALVVRVYRSEYLLGFVLGMAWTFGGVLPTLIGGAIALISAAAWFGLWRVAAHAMRRARA